MNESNYQKQRERREKNEKQWTQSSKKKKKKLLQQDLTKKKPWYLDKGVGGKRMEKLSKEAPCSTKKNNKQGETLYGKVREKCTKNGVKLRQNERK